MSNFNNKVALVTGGSSGIGEATANLLANKGARVFCAQRSKSLHEDILVDFTNTDSAFKIISEIKNKIGVLDILINNAGIMMEATVEELELEEWNDHLNVNLKAPAILTQDFKKYLKSNKRNIVNIIDQRIFKLTPYFFSYTLSKTGLQTLTKTSAMALSPNIRVNGIAPGPTIKNKRQSESHFKKQWKSLILKYNAYSFI